jgi:hypothetical protein
MKRKRFQLDIIPPLGEPCRSNSFHNGDGLLDDEHRKEVYRGSAVII